MSNLKCKLGRFEIHAVDHCNLACVGCNHASPFLKKREYQAEEYFPWIDKLRDGGAEFHTIGVSGGEPFLHKDLGGFVKAVKDRYGCFINLFTNGFWMKDEESIEKHSEVLSRSEIVMLSAYKSIVDKLGGIDRYKELGRKIRERYDNKVGMFMDGVVDKFYQWDFYDKPRHTGIALDCDVKECHQLTVDGLMHRCTVGHALRGHPGVTDGFRNSKDLTYDLNVDPENRSLRSWKVKWPLDACAFCGNSCDKAYPVEWESDPKIRNMGKEEYQAKVAGAKRAFRMHGTPIVNKGHFL